MAKTTKDRQRDFRYRNRLEFKKKLEVIIPITVIHTLDGLCKDTSLTRAKMIEQLIKDYAADMNTYRLEQISKM